MAKRRPRGDGSYIQRPNGTWEYRVRLPDGNRKSIYAKTLDEVRAKKRATERDIELGLDLSAKTQTLNQFLISWLEETAKPSIRPRTYVSYKQIIERHISPKIGSVKLTKLSPQHVQRMMNEMLSSGLSPTTVQRVRAVLRRALGFALKWGLVTRNVATLVDSPRVTPKRAQPLSAEQTQRFLDHARTADDRLWSLYVVAAYTGMRAGELFGLRWSDVDLSSRSLRVSQTVVQLPGGWSFGEPKTEKSARPLPLLDDVVNALQFQRDLQAFERKGAGNQWQDHDLVFTTPKGTPLNPSNVNKHLHASLDSCGLPKMGLHGFRHGCASMMISNGVHMRLVMEWLGHSQIALTMNTYSHVAPAALQQAASALEEAMIGGK